MKRGAHTSPFKVSTVFITPAAPAIPTPIANVALADAANTLCTDELPNVGDDLERELEIWLANEEPCASVNWNEQMAAASTVDEAYELFGDTGANVHISPVRSDFVTFHEISPRPIKGFQGSSIMARGIGTIVTKKLTLEFALYVPGAAIRLLSVLRICQANPYNIPL